VWRHVHGFRQPANQAACIEYLPYDTLEYACVTVSVYIREPVHITSALHTQHILAGQQETAVSSVCEDRSIHKTVHARASWCVCCSRAQMPTRAGGSLPCPCRANARAYPLTRSGTKYWRYSMRVRTCLCSRQVAADTCRKGAGRQRMHGTAAAEHSPTVQQVLRACNPQGMP
jgi:hypothetical protein